MAPVGTEGRARWESEDVAEQCLPLPEVYIALCCYVEDVACEGCLHSCPTGLGISILEKVKKS